MCLEEALGNCFVGHRQKDKMDRKPQKYLCFAFIDFFYDFGASFIPSGYYSLACEESIQGPFCLGDSAESSF